MADVYRVTAVWQGFQGAPGYSKFTFQLLDTQSAIDAAGANVRAFFQSLGTLLMLGWSVQVLQAIQVYDMVTGILLREVSQTSQPAIVNGAASSAAYAGGAGAYVNWNTGAIFNGRRLRGRTYLVPLVGVQATDGTLTPTAISTISSAASTLITSITADLAVWGKQHAAPPGTGQVNGFLASVTSATVPDKTGILKSRRD